MMIIAIGGASCSGKSTLTNWLSKLLNAPIIHQDKFYKPDRDIPVVNGIEDWDCPEAIDFLNFKAALKTVKETSVVGKTF